MTEESTFKKILKLFFFTGLSGGIAAFGGDVLYYPFDTIKVRLQASNLKRNFTEEAKKVHKLRGVRNMVQQNQNQFNQQFFNSFSYGFFFLQGYEHTKYFLYKFNKKYLFANHIAASVIGDSLGCLVKNPFEVIKSQIQVGHDINVRRTAVSIYKSGGIKAFYGGLIAIISRNLAQSTINFPIYEFLKRQYINRYQKGTQNQQHMSVQGATLCSLVSGSIGSFLSTPFDVAKSKLMVQRRKKEYRGVWGTLKKTYLEEGTKGLFRGWHIRVIGLVAYYLAFFNIYEKTQKYFHEKYLDES